MMIADLSGAHAAADKWRVVPYGRSSLGGVGAPSLHTANTKYCVRWATTYLRSVWQACMVGNGYSAKVPHWPVNMP
jgi:hypothetical protein